MNTAPKPAPGSAAGLTPVFSGARLSEQVADQLAEQVLSGQLAPGAKLPTEERLAQQFEVSRTVVREAVARLKSQGLVRSRQGSGVFVAEQLPLRPLNFDLNFDANVKGSKQALQHVVEVRRALESEVAGLAAQRRSKAALAQIQAALLDLDRAVQAGGDGVDEDLRLHRAVAEAAGNPFLLATLDYLAQYLHGTIRVTRANEARRDDFAQQVRQEHAAIVQAIANADPAAAAQAAAQHMHNAMARIASADPDFWQQEGTKLAEPLVKRGVPDTGNA